MSGALATDRRVAPRASRPVLVTGGAGFIGCNVADRLARDGHDVVVLDSLARPGVQRNLDWLTHRHPERIRFLRGDVGSEDAAKAASEASGIFHFAAQVAVTTSLEDPGDDFAVNVQGTLNLLEALRKSNKTAPFIFASTNKVYGDLAEIELARSGDAWLPVEERFRREGVGEDRPLSFHTPYGCSKGAADQYVLDYARSFDIPTAVMRMSCIYGPRQMGTEDQGWVAHFLIRAMKGEPITIFGDGCQVRDILFVDDAVDAYMAVWRKISEVKGLAFNLGGGVDNAVSLLELLAHIRDLSGRRADIEFSPARAGDQRFYVSDARRAHSMLELKPPCEWREGVRRLWTWLETEQGLGAPARATEMQS